MNNPFIAVTTTTGSRAEAQKIGRALVEQKLAACAQIEKVESFYAWDGAVQHEEEFRLLCKTVAARYEAVEAAIRRLHTYELPAIHAIPLERVYAPYGEWLEEHSRRTGAD